MPRAVVAKALSGVGDEVGSRADSNRTLQHRIAALMGARLVLSVLSLVVILALEAAGGDFTTAEWRGFYATVAFAFAATIVYGVVLHRLLSPQGYAALNVVTDVAIVTGLVHFSGGADSVFPFLYVLVAAYSAFLFKSRGALATAAISITAYGAILFAGHRGWVTSLGLAPPEPMGALLMTWLVNAGAVATVAILASLLTSELRRTGAALYQRTSDLRRLENLHQRTVESLMSGLLTTDHDLRITSFNPEAEHITGQSFAEVVGCDVEEVIAGVRILAEIAGQGADRRNPRTRITYRNQHGVDRYLGLAVYVLKESDGAAEGFVVIFQDVTAVVEMEADLRRTERLAAIGELSASIAHEVRNPLASISGSIQMLQSQIGTAVEEGEARKLMAIVLRETDRLNRLITDFLEYARPGPPMPESVDIAAATEDVVKMYESVRPANVEFDLDFQAGLEITADASQLRQIIWNLVLNASEAMPDGGRLRVVARGFPGELPQEFTSVDRSEALQPAKYGWAEIAVSDTGIGMSPDVCERVFDPFFTTKASGSGLGLAAVHRIVSEHSGTARLESVVGQGTTVRLRFPRAEVTQ
ncbi:MAG: PAS domain S-box protein [Deltaproteobacteria bacterium]|nr:PAS domain S-box protein [Deltaproteobacteria bacterium]